MSLITQFHSAMICSTGCGQAILQHEVSGPYRCDQFDCLVVPEEPMPLSKSYLQTIDGVAIKEQTLYVMLCAPNRILAVSYRIPYFGGQLLADAVELTFLPQHPLNVSIQRSLQPIRIIFSFVSLPKPLVELILDYVGNESADALKVAHCSVKTWLSASKEKSLQAAATAGDFILPEPHPELMLKRLKN